MVIEQEVAVAALVAAFRDDPLCGWLFGGDERAGARLFTPFVARSAAAGELAVAGGGDAVAVWLPVAADESGVDTGAELPAELVPYAQRLAAFSELAGSRHPSGRAHLYLPFVGVVPSRRGSGLGSRLLAERLARADRDGMPAYLEASSARSRPLYERHGFSAAGDPITLPDGPVIWPMWREPVPEQSKESTDDQ